MTTTQSDDKWYKVAAGPVYVPLNATACYFDIYTAGQAAAVGTFYIAEPVLKIGSLTSRGLQLGQNEFAASVKIGPNKLSWGAAAPGASTGWHQQGDLHVLTGSVGGGIPAYYCSVSGLDAAATWVQLPNMRAITVGTFTLDNAGGDVSTSVVQTATTADSKIMITATHANSAAAIGSAASVYISAKNAGVGFDVSHPAAPGAGATFDYVLIN
jgi:hypothetical protein